MKSTIGAIALIGGVLTTAAAIALAGSAAFAENRMDEQRAELAKLWGKDSAATASQTATATMNFTGISQQRRDNLTRRWPEDHRPDRQRDRADRQHDRADRGHDRDDGS